MRFYDREDELKTLRRIEADSHESARFVVLTGRRRVGKTELVKHAFGEDGEGFHPYGSGRQYQHPIRQYL